MKDIKKVQELLIKNFPKIKKMWEKIDNEIYTPLFNLTKEKIRYMYKDKDEDTINEIYKLSLQTPKERKNYVNKRLEEIINKYMNEVYMEITEIIDNNISLNKLLDITKLIYWGFEKLENKIKSYLNKEIYGNELKLITQKLSNNSLDLQEQPIYTQKILENKIGNLIKMTNDFWRKELKYLEDKLCFYIN